MAAEAKTYIDTKGTKASGSLGAVLKAAQDSTPKLTGGK